MNCKSNRNRWFRTVNHDRIERLRLRVDIPRIVGPAVSNCGPVYTWFGDLLLGELGFPSMNIRCDDMRLIFCDDMRLIFWAWCWRVISVELGQSSWGNWSCLACQCVDTQPYQVRFQQLDHHHVGSLGAEVHHYWWRFHASTVLVMKMSCCLHLPCGGGGGLGSPLNSHGGGNEWPQVGHKRLCLTTTRAEETLAVRLLFSGWDPVNRSHASLPPPCVSRACNGNK